jgi:acyl transferase domain-containing protein/acyl carrier protein
MSNEESKTGLEIAVIGMSGRFPAAKDIEQFWWNLRNGVESIVFFSEEELIEGGIDHGTVKNPDYVKACGILADTEYFDSAFFEYTPNEVEIMDPQIRIFHECAWQALEDAGYCAESYDGLIGLYAGSSPNFRWEVGSILSGKCNRVGGFAASQLRNRDYTCLRTSYKLNLTGPSVFINTTCSTSLVAIHMACQGLLSGECDLALAGGATISGGKKEGYLYQEGMIMPPDGHCRAFDAKAKGVVLGNGVGVVVLKRLEEAITEGDTIHAVVKGSAINNDGIRKVGFTAPSVEGQAEVIKTALYIAEVEPETIGYVETHGTGTSFGDPVEIEGLKLAFNMEQKEVCRIGSVKTNIGHLDSAAGVAGFIKVVLALKHKLIPPSLHFETPNPKIDLKNSPFYINRELSEWRCDGHPLRAGVSSFGIGGTNAHVILEEAPDLYKDEVCSSPRNYRLILLSAKTQTALDRITENLVGYFKKNPRINLADAAYSLQVGRKRFQYRKMLVCSNVTGASELLPDQSEKIHSYFSEKPDEIKPIIFMFPGQGAQYVNMGLDLYQTEPVFREEMDLCLEIVKPLMDYDLKEILYPPSDCRGGSPDPPGPENSPLERGAPEGRGVSNHINQTEITQPVIFILEYALAKLLIKWGIKPAAMIGHSIGEYTAACLSGVLSLPDALKLVVSRGKLMQGMPTGAMLGVPLPEEELKPLLDDEISLAAVNAPSFCVVSGSHKAIDAFSAKLEKKGCECNRLHTSHPFHSKIMEPIQEEFEKIIKSVKFNKPEIPYISNVTGKWLTDEQVKDSRYWIKHLRNTVRFSDGVNELLQKEDSIFIEVGPGQVLSTLVRKHLNKKNVPFIVNLVRHPRENVADDAYLLSKLGQLWLWGETIDWSGYYQGEKRYRIPLPAYSFDGYPYQSHYNPLDMTKNMLSKENSLSKTEDIADWFYIPLWKQTKLSILNSVEIPTGSQVLFFIDACDFGSRLVKRFEQSGQHVTIVKAGTGFRNESQQVYYVNPKESNDYDTLFKELKKLKRIPNMIVHSWNITENNNRLDFTELEKVQDLGFFSLINIARAIGKQVILDHIQIKVVTNNMQSITGEEELHPGKSTVLGPVKVIPGEYSNLSCHSIDIVLPEPGSVKDERLIDQLSMELMLESPDNVIAYRGIHRWKQVFEPIRVEKSRDETQRLREKGIYLITGGLGGIGLVLGEYLAKTVHARLILIGRSPFPEKAVWKEWLETHDAQEPTSRKIRGVQELENLGAEVIVLNADVSNQEEMQKVMIQAKEKFGEINGIIHAAGIPDGALIQRGTRNILESVFKSKVRGTLVLDTVLNDNGIDLDFLFFCSSLTSIFSPIGQVGYCAANNFLDSYAHHKTLKDNVFTVSVNWDTWRETGMAVEAVKYLTRGQDQGSPADHPMLKHGISPLEGQEVFSRILGVVSPQVAISTRNLPALIKKFNNQKNEQLNKFRNSVEKTPGEVLHQRPGLSVTYVAPKSNIEKIIARAWQEVLGLDKVGVDDNFFEIGGDSLMIIELNKKLVETLKKEIPVQLMFNYSTVRSLSKYLSQEEKGPDLSDREIQQSKVLKHSRDRMKKTINKIIR